MEDTLYQYFKECKIKKGQVTFFLDKIRLPKKGGFDKSNPYTR
jgi:hypothetical protein